MPSLFSGLRARKVVMVTALLALVISLQGCAMDVPIHRVANWRAEPDYLMINRFVPPGVSAESGSINSCSYPRLSEALQCSGRGTCKRWVANNLDNDLAFCECDRDWGGPECRTRRKSQTVAYVLSVFGGFLGVDQFYLGYYSTGLLKLFSLGGVGIWWIYDIVRIGSAPVHAAGTYRTAHDLPHFAYVITIVMFASVFGFAISHKWIMSQRFMRRRQQMNLTLDEETQQRPKELDKPFAAAYHNGWLRPIIQQPSEYPDFEKMFPYKQPEQQGGQQGSAGYGSMGGAQPSMGAGQMPSMGAGQMPSMAGGQMPSMGGDRLPSFGR